jgi:hypothetical protein
MPVELINGGGRAEASPDPNFRPDERIYLPPCCNHIATIRGDDLPIIRPVQNHYFPTPEASSSGLALLHTQVPAGTGGWIMFTDDFQQQLPNEGNIYDENVSPTERLSDVPPAPAPGIEDLRVSDLGREFNPNTE